jgi:hypothetical protein
MHVLKPPIPVFENSDRTHANLPARPHPGQNNHDPDTPPPPERPPPPDQLPELLELLPLLKLSLSNEYPPEPEEASGVKTLNIINSKRNNPINGA